MKIAISLPDNLCKAIDDCARELRLTRSGLLARAACEFLARRRHIQNPTEAWNLVIDEAGQPGDDPAASAFRRRARSVIRATHARRR